MKSLSGALVISIFLSITCHAQKSPIKFGNIPMEDMTLSVYPQDSSAAAVVLTDYGVAGLQVTALNATMNLERHTRIKILTKDGLGSADIQIYLNNGDRISSLKAVTYNLENGAIVETKMSKDAVFKEKFDKYTDIQKFTLPNVKEGSVIEYSYTQYSEAYWLFPNWKFQRNIPSRISEYWANIPDFFTYQKYMQGYISASYEVVPKPQAKSHHWICRNVPAFKEEPYMTSEEDYISRINFALATIQFPGHPMQEVMQSWVKLNQDLSEDAGFTGVLKGSGFLKKSTEEVITGLTDETAKLKAIDRYVKQNVEWNGIQDYYPDENLKKIIEQKKGTSGDINFILGSMLTKAGFTVDMVLLSTRSHGFIRKEYPMQRQFNYVVCAVRIGEKVTFLDATEPYLPMGILPDRCLNGEGFVISKTRSAWIPVESKLKSKSIVSADLLLSADGTLKGKIDYIRDGYYAQKMRKTVSSKGEESYKKELYTGKSWELDSCLFENLTDLDKPAKEKHEVTINEHVSTTAETMYINPIVTTQLAANPFRLKTREYPVDFGNPIENIYLCKIKIPEDYTIEEMPQSKVFLLPGNAAKFTYNVSQNGGVISVVSNLQINKSMFIQTEYESLRLFYDQVVAKQTEQIVLKKKQ